MAIGKGSRVPEDQNLSPELKKFHDKEARRTDTLEGDLGTAQTDITTLQTDLAAAQAAITALQALPSPAVFTKIFTSSQQTITAAGSLSLSHGLTGVAAIDLNVQVMLVCQTGELGYTIGDVAVIASGSNEGAANKGVSIVPTSTTLDIRYASAGTVFTLIRKDNGNAAAITLANWKAVFRAWA